MTKSRPTRTPPSRRSIRAHKAWNVQIHGRRAPVAASDFTRSRISSAALFVKVTASSSPGSACPSAISRAARQAMTRVLPDPAPARTRSGPSVCSTACFCSAFRSEMKSMGRRFVPRAGRASAHRQATGFRRWARPPWIIPQQTTRLGGRSSSPVHPTVTLLARLAARRRRDPRRAATRQGQRGFTMGSPVPPVHPTVTLLARFAARRRRDPRRTATRQGQRGFTMGSPVPPHHSTVTLLARLRGWSTSQPRRTAMW